MKARMYTVYRQAEPIETSEPMGRTSESGRTLYWHRSNLVPVGLAASFEEARALCARPIMDADVSVGLETMGQRIVGARRWQ